MRVLSPLRYPGGKGQVYPYVEYLVEINNIKTYIEPFAGGATVALRLLLNKKVDKIMINDYDRAIFAFWYSVKYHSELLIEKIIETPITMTEWYKQKKIYLNRCNHENLVELGFATLFLNRTNRSGILKAGVIGGKDQKGNYKMDCRFNKASIIKRISDISEYRNKMYIYNLDAEDFIKKSISKTKSSFTFFDPPYYKKGPDLYTSFYSKCDHENLSKAIQKHMSEKKWILTYDVHKEIKMLYEDFDYHKYYLSYSINRPTKGIEYLFTSKGLKIGNANLLLNILKE